MELENKKPFGQQEAPKLPQQGEPSLMFEEMLFDNKKVFEKDKDGYQPIYSHKEWKGMYNNLLNDWEEDTKALRQTGRNLELKNIDLEINTLKMSIIYSQKIIQEKLKNRSAIVQMRKDLDTIEEYRDEKEHRETQEGYERQFQKGEIILGLKED